MNESEKKFLEPPFSHIYVEPEALQYEVTRNILNKFRNSQIIEIKHYKDVFNRTHQIFPLQKKSPSLILAVKHGEYVYTGAKVCQSFGNEHFYYTSNVMNCVYDCEYCYLQGMYPSANMVIFVNQEDIFAQVDKLLSTHSVYLCISYDTDLLAIESLTGFVNQWIEFAAVRPALKIEIRTKSAYLQGFGNFKRCDNVIFAWTLSPDEIIEKYEHHTPCLSLRLKALIAAIDSGYITRLCFDPMIICKDFERIYGNMFKKVFSEISPSEFLDISIGTFRISSDYLKRMKKSRLGKITSYPYTNTCGVCGYEPEIIEKMLCFAEKEIRNYAPKADIFRI